MVSLYRCSITLYTSDERALSDVYFIVSNQRCINPFTTLSLYHPEAVDTDLTNTLALHCVKPTKGVGIQTQLVVTNSGARSYYVYENWAISARFINIINIFPYKAFMFFQFSFYALLNILIYKTTLACTFY